MKNYKLIFDEIVDTLLITDGTSGNIIDVSGSITPLLGYSKSELINKHFSLIFDDSDFKTNGIVLSDINVFGSVVSERRLKAKNGSIVHADMTINTITEDGKTYVLTSLRDISERLQYENQIRKMNEELKVLNASKDKLFSIIAHDLKNPLMALMGFSNMMIEDSKTITAEEIEEISTTINQLTKETHTLLDNLLTWARIQTDSFMFEKSRFILSQEVERIFMLLSHSAELKNVTLFNNVDSKIQIYADPNMIVTMLRNLISNAIKFSSDNKEIVVDAEQTPERTKIIVSDEGVGIAPEQIDNLFKIDVQTTTLGTKGEKGTGLGLILCNEFVKLHDGNIHVESEVNKGTVFTILLPNN